MHSIQMKCTLLPELTFLVVNIMVTEFCLQHFACIQCVFT